MQFSITGVVNGHGLKWNQTYGLSYAIVQSVITR